MAQFFQIVIEPRFTAATQNISSSGFTNLGDYYLNSLDGLGGGVVTAYNVRGFLNDQNNEVVVTDFFNFLTASTNSIEYSEIFYSDQKLSDTFNYFFNNYIINFNNSLVNNTALIDAELTGTSAYTLYLQTHNWDGQASIESMSGLPLQVLYNTDTFSTSSQLVSYTSEESYYVNISLSNSFQEIGRNNFFDVEEIIPKVLNPGNPWVIRFPLSGIVINQNQLGFI